MTMTEKVAWIIGITGQDGSYLSDILINKNYIIYGTIRRSSNINTMRIEKLRSHENFNLIYGDLTDSSNIIHTLQKINTKHPESIIEIYNLGAQSHVKVSFELPEYTSQVDAIGTLRIIEAIRICNISEKTKLYQASTSELYGLVQEIPQTETTPFYPRSPYGVAKLYGYWIVKNYRESYDMFLCNGILFNHESSKRGLTFVTRKITIGIAKILAGKEQFLFLGNIDSKRDWGHAKDYCRAMWMILQHDNPNDYVISTGVTRSVRDFVELAFKKVGININWRGQGINEEGFDKITGRVYVKIDPKYYRPAEVDLLVGDSTKAKNILGWQPQISFDEMVTEMIENDCENYGVKINKNK